MNYVVMSEVETEREMVDFTFSSDIVYLFDPPLEIEEEDAQALSGLVEEYVTHNLFREGFHPEFVD